VSLWVLALWVTGTIRKSAVQGGGLLGRGQFTCWVGSSGSWDMSTYDDGLFTDRHDEGFLSRQVGCERTCKARSERVRWTRNKKLSRAQAGI
jgi:hypothetical protein